MTRRAMAVRGRAWVLSLGAVALGWSGLAQAQTGTMDQLSPVGSASFNTSATSLTWQQQIRVGVGGTLEGIAVPVTGGAGSRAAIRIRAGAGWSTGALLFDGFVVKTTSAPETVFVDMSGAGISLAAGSLFVMDVQGDGSGLGWQGSYGSPPAYSQQLCLNGACPYSDGNWRMGFTTYMVECDSDGVVDPGEQCDDGNSTPGDGCYQCRIEYCGNAVVDSGEVCDDGNTASGDGCSSDCRSNETCGNGVVDVATGEACDDGNTTSGDGCQSTCALPSCGDGTLDAGEVCDDGNTTSGDGCNATCTSNESCGNGVVDGVTGEQCDDGGTAAGDGCGATCRIETCGNGITDPGEACDDGNTSGADGCSADCRSDETCGNGVADALVGEQCDDGGTATGDGCGATCRLEICGNGIADPGEACDDGNVASGDGCSSDCRSDETCGNGVVDVAAGEACDDGNTTDGDECSASCALPSCGDGTLDTGEACDDGNTTDGDGCNATCTSDETCGNGVVDGAAGEQCDDGNTATADGCGATCRIETCGNGITDPGELCDDGNPMGGDGCSSDCTSDETCGNGVVDVAAGESCDDGNTTDGDGCSATCALPSCGDGVLDTGEVCDDGNTTDADGCNAACSSDESCGNGIVDRGAGEMCDEGAANSASGPCGTDCRIVMGAVTPDAGIVPNTDAGVGADGGAGTVAGGCGCRTAAQPGAGHVWLLALLGALWLARRRRR